VTLDSGHYCIYTKASSWFAYQIDLDGQIKVTNSASAVCT
jgi:hypothetical protein